jgi:hypothetical protein
MVQKVILSIRTKMTLRHMVAVLLLKHRKGNTDVSVFPFKNCTGASAPSNLFSSFFVRNG